MGKMITLHHWQKAKLGTVATFLDKRRRCKETESMEEIVPRILRTDSSFHKQLLCGAK
jgi:hypothetical protein